MSEERTNKHTETHACDSISRQKAIDTVKKMRAVCDTDSIEDYEALLETAFEVLPSVQPEIIRCKDCKHKPTPDEDGEPEFPTNRCPCQCEDFYYSWMPKDDWFCGNAERREE